MLENNSLKAKFQHVIFTNFIRSFLLCSAAILAGCGTFNSTLNTQVSGSGNSITLDWEAKHPLAKQLQGDSNIRLRAEYRINGKPAKEILASARGNEKNKIEFVLPNRLRSSQEPDGDICLYIQLSNRQIPLLPVRAASTSNRNTGGFRYPTWEKILKENMQRHRFEREHLEIDKKLQAIQTLISDIEQKLLEQGVKIPEDCERITQQSTKVERPFDVVNKEHHNSTARKICIRQARNLNYIWTNRVPSGSVQNISDLISGYATTTTSARNRQEQAKTFLHDWNQWFSSVGPSYQPEVGTPNNRLPTVSSADDLIVDLFNGHTLNQSDLATLAGAILDAYDGCIEDTRKQLMTKLEAWQKKSQNKPDREKAYTDYAKQQCRKEIADKAEFKNQARELQARIDNYHASLANSPTVLSNSRQTLNFQECGMH